jgi:predicted  nucleic acid-binding Zn-ribbon protein
VGDTETARVASAMKELDQLLGATQEALKAAKEAVEDDQLAGVDLQNLLQKQEQTLQMMSNVSKLLFDTAMALVRKIGG